VCEVSSTHRWKIRYSRRSDTTEIIQGAGGHQSLLVSGMCSILEPHSAGPCCSTGSPVVSISVKDDPSVSAAPPRVRRALQSFAGQRGPRTDRITVVAALQSAATQWRHARR